MESSNDEMFDSINELLKQECNGKFDSQLIETDHKDGIIPAQLFEKLLILRLSQEVNDFVHSTETRISGTCIEIS